MKEKSMTKNHGGSVGRGIIEKEALIREASERHLGGVWEAPGKHLGSIREASGTPGGHGASQKSMPL